VAQHALRHPAARPRPNPITAKASSGQSPRRTSQLAPRPNRASTAATHPRTPLAARPGPSRVAQPAARHRAARPRPNPRTAAAPTGLLPRRTRQTAPNPNRASRATLHPKAPPATGPAAHQGAPSTTTSSATGSSAQSLAAPFPGPHPDSLSTSTTPPSGLRAPPTAPSPRTSSQTASCTAANPALTPRAGSCTLRACSAESAFRG
jgi:hypothetical protein